MKRLTFQIDIGVHQDDAKVFARVLPDLIEGVVQSMMQKVAGVTVLCRHITARPASNDVDDCGNCKTRFTCPLSPHYQAFSNGAGPEFQKCLNWKSCYQGD